MKLFDASNPGTRATRVRWLLEELGAPYEREVLVFAKGDTKTPEYMARHPHGKVPAVELDGQRLIESAAICMHLSDLHSAAGLAPALGTPERALWYQWIVYAASTLDEPLISRIFHTAIFPEERRDPALVEKADAVWALAGPYLESALEGRTWLLGDAFSSADVVLGYDIALAGRMGLLETYPALGAYLGRLSSRPAFQAAYTA